LPARGATEGWSHHHDQGFGAKTAENRRKRAEPPIMERERGRGQADRREEHTRVAGEAVVYCSGLIRKVHALVLGARCPSTGCVDRQGVREGNQMPEAAKRP
jgi:hypothetical protein